MLVYKLGLSVCACMRAHTHICCRLNTGPLRCPVCSTIQLYPQSLIFKMKKKDKIMHKGGHGGTHLYSWHTEGKAGKPWVEGQPGLTEKLLSQKKEKKNQKKIQKWSNFKISWIIIHLKDTKHPRITNIPNRTACFVAFSMNITYSKGVNTRVWVCLLEWRHQRLARWLCEQRH